MEAEDVHVDSVFLESDIIQPIQKGTVHRICSGQVVLNLSIAVKELIENSIDANATSVDVRLVEYGSISLEVVDNGSGVKSENFQALALKHYTSKLREFRDLESVSTLGFRGEALSSLCALSDLTITTRHSSAEHGTKICYDHNGRIASETPCARQVGTTVTITNLFASLPVRRKEFLKNLKREFNKMTNLLYAYCLVSEGIKFTCTNQTKAGARSTVVATQGNNSVQENVICVFGTRQLPSLLEIRTTQPDETILEEFALKGSAEDEGFFMLHGLISSCTHGCGRSATDRQYVYINSRPCEPGRVIKIVNEVYRRFNGNQYPFVYLNVTMRKDRVDVNVTPDKRQVFVENEKLLLATIKMSLLETFKTVPSTFKLQNVDIKKEGKLTDQTTDVNSETKSSDVLANSLKRVLLDISVEDQRGTKRRHDDDEERSVEKKVVRMNKHNHYVQQSIFNFGKPTLSESSDSESSGNETKECSLRIESTSRLLDRCAAANPTSKRAESDDEEQETISTIECDKIKTIALDKRREKPTRNEVTSNASMNLIRSSLARRAQKKRNESDDVADVRFSSKINPESNKKAEEELAKQFDKDSFKRMEIIGQFNLGFIITKLDADLFIIDQHATDEKYNFETLQRTTVLDTQVLVNPKPLQLTSASESLLIENVEIFRKNGFLFRIDEEAEATKKVLLTGIPMSKNYVFGKDDIDEMLFMLQDASQTMCRPSRVRSMFASRACRSSVMIGSHLSQSDMRRLVDHMGEIEHPWNCPHGRPTMRHLINLNLLEN